MQRDEPTLPESLDESLLRAGFATDDDSAGLIRQSLRAMGARHRILALRAGVRRSLVSSDDWIDALGESESEVRREAVNLAATATIGDERVFAAIVHLLDDGDPLVVDGAGFALGEHRYIDAVVPLARIARDHDDARCRECAVAALGVLGDDRGRAAVLAALDDKAPVRRRAIVALTNFEGPDIDAALERASKDRDWQVRAAVDQLARDDDH